MDIHDVLGRFVKYPEGFRSVMRLTRSIVSGSALLQLLLRETWAGSDLDVFVPVRRCNLRRFSSVVGYLERFEGYKESVTGDEALYRFCPGIMDQVALRRMDEAGGASAVHVVAVLDVMEIEDFILEFWGTHLVNFATADAVVCLFPEMTLKRREFCFLRRLAGRTLAEKAEKYMKYRDRRGFRAVNFSSDDPELGGVRGVGDEKSLVVYLGEDGKEKQEGEPTWNMTSFVVAKKGVQVLREEGDFTVADVEKDLGVVI